MTKIIYHYRNKMEVLSEVKEAYHTNSDTNKKAIFQTYVQVKFDVEKDKYETVRRTRK